MQMQIAIVLRGTLKSHDLSSHLICSIDAPLRSIVERNAVAFVGDSWFPCAGQLPRLPVFAHVAAASRRDVIFSPFPSPSSGILFWTLFFFFFPVPSFLLFLVTLLVVSAKEVWSRRPGLRCTDVMAFRRKHSRLFIRFWMGPWGVVC